MVGLIARIGLSGDELTIDRESIHQLLPLVDGESQFRASQHVWKDRERRTIVYAAGERFIRLRGRHQPEYEIRVVVSETGEPVTTKGRVVLPVDQEFYAHGRPWIYEYRNGLILCVSSRERATGLYVPRAFALNFSSEKLVGEELTESIFGSDHSRGSYPVIFETQGSTYLLFCSADFGLSGSRLYELSGDLL